MRKILAGILLAIFLPGLALAQTALTPPPLTWRGQVMTPAPVFNLGFDTISGFPCIPGQTITCPASGGVGGTFTCTAASSAPTYIAGPNPFSCTLTGDTRVYDAAVVAAMATATPAGTFHIGSVGVDFTATPIGGSAVAIATGGTAVTAVAANAKGCIIQNPLTTTDQGIGTVEPLYISQVTTALTAGNVSTFALAPGQSWSCVPGSTLGVSVNAATSAHKFAVTSW